MKVHELNSWLATPLFYPNPITPVQLINESFEKYRDLLKVLNLNIKNEDNFRKKYCIFFSMYSMNTIKTTLNTTLKKDKSCRVAEAFITLYSNHLIDFIKSEQSHYYTHGIEILQKKSKFLFLEFVLLTLKNIDIDIMNLI
jgi:hypothetical protein